MKQKLRQKENGILAREREVEKCFLRGRFPVKRLMTVRKGRPGLFPERLFFLSRCRKLCTKFEKGLKIGHSRFRPVVSGGIGNIKGEEMQRRMFAQCLAVP